MKSSILIAFALTLSHLASAAVITLDMSSLPSAQGWTYTATGSSHAGQVETSIWNANGTRLAMNTMGSGLVSPSGNIYQRLGEVNAVDPIVIEWTSRVLQSEGASYGWYVGVNDGAHSADVGFRTDGITLALAPIISFNTTQFHDYRLEYTPGAATFSLFVDNNLFATQTALASTLNRIGFGDGTGAANAQAEMTSYRFSQVPEPSAAGMLLLGALAVMASRQRK
jgi:hypothetical protein